MEQLKSPAVEQTKAALLRGCMNFYPHSYFLVMDECFFSLRSVHLSGQLSNQTLEAVPSPLEGIHCAASSSPCLLNKWQLAIKNILAL